MFYRLFRVGFFVFIGAIMFVPFAYGANKLIVNSIKIKGMTYRDDKLIVSRIPIIAGKYFSDEDVDASIKYLYSTGYFSDVKIDVVGSVLVINVVENKIINQVVFSGNKKISDASLEQLIGIHPSSSYNKDLVDSSIKLIKKYYSYAGYPTASVDIQVYNISPGTINICYVITEGIRTKISNISFSGNKSYSSNRLGRVISLKTSGYFPFLAMGADIYSKERLSYDEQLIRNFYYNRGYAGVKVSSKAVFNNNRYDLTFNIDEGSVYRISKVIVRSDLQSVPHDKLLSLINNESGDLYSAQVIEENVLKITNYLYSIGNPFAYVTHRVNRDFINNTVNVEYIVDQGPPLYVDRIDIRGNVSIYDYVIRRELGFSEGDPINQAMIERSRRRIMATGHFSDVLIDQLSSGIPDHVLLTIRVKQSSDAVIKIGASCGDSLECSFDSGFSDGNFLGRGYDLGLNFSFSGNNFRDYNLNFVNPYFFNTPIASGFNLMKSYSTDKFFKKDISGLRLHARFPVLENISTTSKFGYDVLKYGNADNNNSSDFNRELVSHGKFNSLFVSQSVEYSTLDNINMPRNGLSLSSDYEYAGFRGDSNYHKLTQMAHYFKLLSDNYDIIGSMRFRMGHIFPRNENLQFFDQFMIGPGNLRGFARSGIGPRLKKDGLAIGGRTYVSASAEVDFPMAFASDDSGLRGTFFVDTATLHNNAFRLNNNSDIDGNDPYFRVAAGVSIVMHVPIFGKMSIYYGIPILKQSYDVVMPFGFTIGNSI
ncbi:outer membrane protein assembly factor BamA [Candidatus Liberibacter americanus]|uniref:Outer membrane protein assembly factor BamA n=1 Tax=Candidatus Liberibacter americanus str. Sao Paulo TaxID=1261131 RepID=U6B736_9HYPH|nr:outer membrane protein assembly factor BamA [Candidatus Liberibacter americanus]AHA27562.1 Outer membrane protein/protective antigen OMA87 [Candidatus Liberibacter americanus str. Sao Paulo]EMS36477.1 surface antigen (D15) [Candidatus Liberibacter americanus PW_SP]